MNLCWTSVLRSRMVVLLENGNLEAGVPVIGLAIQPFTPSAATDRASLTFGAFSVDLIPCLFYYHSGGMDAESGNPKAVIIGDGVPLTWRTTSVGPPETVYGYVCFNNGGTETFGSLLLAQPVTFTEAKQIFSLPEVAFTFPPSFFVY
jgi:hypothetical protein